MQKAVLPDICAIVRRVISTSHNRLHRRDHRVTNQPHIDKIASNERLTYGSLYFEIEEFVCAIQDQVPNTRNYKKYILLEMGQQMTSAEENALKEPKVYNT